VTNPQLSDDADAAPVELAVAQPTDKISVITVACELDMVTTPAFGHLLTQELDNADAAVLVDLSGCDFMGSSGLAALIAAREHADRTFTRLVLAGLNRTVKRSFAATNLDPLFTIYPTTGDALADLTSDT
jgi:anti-anti-sigma factor